MSERAPPKPTSQVTLIFDQTFGERLRTVTLPAWITMSDTNAPIVRELWTESPGCGHLEGITGFTEAPDGEPASRLLRQLDNIDLHHGPMSTNSPFTELRVIGLRLAETARLALVDYGFVEFREDTDGFTALRREDEADKPRI